MEGLTKPTHGYEHGLLCCHQGNIIDVLFSFCCGMCSFGEWYGRRRPADEFTTNAVLGALSMCIPILGCYCLCQERKASQTESGTPESDLMLIFETCCCACCAVVQERDKYMKTKGEPKLITY
eukprot:CAMPEP_0184699522 /NCGR_PEP_ID=MMETSP0313-20130426/5775_1 /TAXON_ID=2792 /ORGANISM="Porphyridium aerugineum, Strain SAG 1380-2" /LENGTH=122 /DNA_ID=CAMNT_0027158633 /DNA_START=97 /DNA_END=465 /DNA_ORIENTATION=+